MPPTRGPSEDEEADEGADRGEAGGDGGAGALVQMWPFSWTAAIMVPSADIVMASQFAPGVVLLMVSSVHDAPECRVGRSPDVAGP